MGYLDDAGVRKVKGGGRAGEESLGWGFPILTGSRLFLSLEVAAEPGAALRG